MKNSNLKEYAVPEDGGILYILVDNTSKLESMSKTVKTKKKRIVVVKTSKKASKTDD